jgi:hypothetical protein
MKITKRQLRKIIKEAIEASDRIYLDDFTSGLFDLKYDNKGEEWIMRPEDFQRLKTMNQYDTAHQKIFMKYESQPSTIATGAGYGWWELK